MSWSVNAEGTKEEVSAKVAKDLDQCAGYYTAIGDPEQQDIFAVKARVLALVAAMTVPDGKRVHVEANGSHSWGDGGKSNPQSASFAVKAYLV